MRVDVVNENQGHGWADVTAATISRLKLRLEELDETPEPYEVERPGALSAEAFRKKRSL